MVIRLLLLMLALLVPAKQAEAIDAVLPQLFVDTTMPTTTITKTVCAAGCDYLNTQLQLAIDQAVLGTKILLQPGITYAGPAGIGFVLRNKTTGSGWIVIQTNTALPPVGTRVCIPLIESDDPLVQKCADAANFAKITRVNTYATTCDLGAHHYRLIGIEIMNPGNVDSTDGGTFVNCSDNTSTSTDQRAHHIILDRVYIHGPAAPQSHGVKFGTVLNGSYMAVINSTCQDLTYGTDAQCFGAWAGSGPWLYDNNHISSSGENINFGGSDSAYLEHPSDITVTRNHIYKPLKWRDSTQYNSGTWFIHVKNLVEMKHAVRSRWDSNIMENMWPGAQGGFAVVFGPRQGQGPCPSARTPDPNVAPWTIITDVTITNNLILNVPFGFSLSGQDPSPFCMTQIGGRFTLRNNLIVGVGGYTGAGHFVQVGNQLFDLTVQHNTYAAPRLFNGAFTGIGERFTESGGTLPYPRLIWQDNISFAGQYPRFPTTITAMDLQAPGEIWTRNIVYGPFPSSAGITCTSVAPNNFLPAPPGTYCPANEAAVGFANPTYLTDPAHMNYGLASGVGKGGATDGKDIGIDWTVLQASIANVIPPGAPDITPPGQVQGITIK